MGDAIARGLAAKARPLAGKKMVCLGDSVTEFGNYPVQIAARTGATTYNCGFGGTRLSTHGEANYDKFSMAKLVDAIVSGDFTAQDAANTALGNPYANLVTLKGINFNTIDYVTIFYGTNDYAGTVTYPAIPIGLDSDTTRATVKGAVAYIVSTLLTAFPHLKIAFITPFWRSRIVSGDGLESDNNPNSIGSYLIDYGDAIRTMAQKRHIPAFDFYRNSGFNQYNELTFLTDGVHPTTPVGYEHVGNKISSFLISTF